MLQSSKVGIKKAVSFASFLVCVAVIWVLFTYLFRPVDSIGYGRSNILHFYNEKKDSVEVVALGASGTYRFYDPMAAWEEYGFTSYTYSTAGLQGSAYITALKDIYRTQSPELVIVDARRFTKRKTLSEMAANYQRYMDALDLTGYRMEGVSYFSKLHQIPLNEAVVSYLDLIQYHENYYALWNPDHWRLVLNREKKQGKDFKGFMIAAGIQPQQPFTGSMEAGQEEAVLDKTVQRIYEEFLTYCQKKGCNILLTVSPCDYDAETMKEVNTLERIAGEYGFPFINANTPDAFAQMDIDFGMDFYDSNHMNLLGAEKYTAYIAAYVHDHYNLPDHRNEAAYSAWNDDLAAYHEKADEAHEKLRVAAENGIYEERGDGSDDES